MFSKRQQVHSTVQLFQSLLTLSIQTMLQSGTTFILSEVDVQGDRLVPLKIAPSISKPVSMRLSLFPTVLHVECKIN